METLLSYILKNASLEYLVLGDLKTLRGFELHHWSSEEKPKLKPNYQWMGHYFKPYLFYFITLAPIQGTFIGLKTDFGR